MRSEVVNAANVDSVEWDDQQFKLWEFDSFSLSGEIVTSDFLNCTFNNVDWYWGIFTLASFIGCKMINCTFRGTSFSDAKFEFTDAK